MLEDGVLVFQQVMVNTMALYNLKSPFFDLTYGNILFGFFVISLSIGCFRYFFNIAIHSGDTPKWKEKKYSRGD